MKLSAVTLARVLAFVETYDLNPQGTVFFPDLVAKIVEKFRFQKFPQTVAEFDEQKGVEFLEGTWAGVNVDKMTIYNNGILLDTRVSTSTSEQILAEAFEWAKQFGLTYEAGMIKRTGYLSSFTFHSDVPLLGPTTAAIRLARSVSEIVQKRTNLNVTYQPNRLDFDFERPLTQQIPIAPLTIQRRATTPFAENKILYGSAAKVRRAPRVAGGV